MRISDGVKATRIPSKNDCTAFIRQKIGVKTQFDPEQPMIANRYY
jgi:hypothetical protein